jgi:hypothetical protein
VLGPESPLAQLMIVREVVYAMAKKPKIQRMMSEIFQSLDLATAL